MADSRASLRSTLGLINPLIAGHRKALVAVVLCAVLGGFAEAVVLVVIARLSFALAAQHEVVGMSLGPLGEVSISVWALLGIAGGLIIARVAVQLVGALISSRLGSQVASEYRSRLVSAYLNASWELQSRARPGQLQELVGTFVRDASNAVSTLANALVALVTLLTFLVTAVAVDVVAAIGVAASAVGLAMLLRPLRTAVRRSSRRLAQANLEVGTGVTETAAHQLEIRVFGTEDVVTAQLARGFQQVRGLEARRGFLTNVAPVVYQGTALMLLVATVAVLFAAGVTGLGAIGGVVLIMLRSLSYGQTLQGTYQTLHSSAPSIERLRHELTRYEAAALDRSGEPMHSIGSLQFDNVSFKYEAGVPVLRHVSFSVPRGEIVGIIGPSGAGKSTLVQLILRLRNPTEGRVLGNGRDVRTLKLADWYERVSFVPQDSALFAGSIADNIRFYRPDIDHAAIEKAAKSANLHQEVMDWPMAYETPVGERGGQLSGGQRQRLCIARALAESPDLIVFDESTSALDAKSEAVVRDTIAGLAPDATVFVIAHRLSTLDICDRIMVLVDGQLLGFDEPSKLEASSPFYREVLELSGLR